MFDYGFYNMDCMDDVMKSMKELCMGWTEEDLDAWFMERWDSLSKQIRDAGVYYQMCLDNGVVVDVYAILN